MANITPNGTPAGGFPLRLSTQTDNGTVVTVTFPTSAAVNPGNAAAEAAFKQMRVALAAGGHGVAAT